MVTFHWLTFHFSQVSQKALFIPLKFYFKNRKLIKIKINVNVEVFFFFTIGVTDQFWQISRRKFPFFNYPPLPNTTQPDYGEISLLSFLLFGFYSREKIADDTPAPEFLCSKVTGLYRSTLFKKGLWYRLFTEQPWSTASWILL